MQGTWGRRVATASVALSLGLTGAACSSRSSPTGDAGGQTASTQFVIARTGDIDLLDPHRATAFQTVQTLGLIYGNLVKADSSGKLHADLATEWSYADAGRTVTFTLRQGVRFHNGDPFTSADVKASITRLQDEKTSAVARSNLSGITGVDTPDDHTLVLHLKAADSALLYALSAVNAAVLDAKDIAADTVGKKPNGTGPFSFGSWQQNRDLTLKASQGYWGGAPKLATVIFRIIPDEPSILAGMRAHSFQMATISDPTVAQQVSGDAVTLVKQPALSYHALMLNGRRAPLDKPAVRQAIACAVDRQQVITTVANGDGKVTGPITSPAFDYSATQGLPCTAGDTAKAGQLLAGAGFGPDHPVKLRAIVETGEYATSVAEGQNLQAQLKAIGIQLTLEQEATDSYVKRWLAADYDAAVALNGGSYSPYTMYGRYFTTGGSLGIPAGLDSPDLSALLNRANQETDDAAQHQLYQQVQEKLLELSPWVWLFRGDDYYLLSPTVHGFVPMPNQSLQYLAETSVG